MWQRLLTFILTTDTELPLEARYRRRTFYKSAVFIQKERKGHREQQFLFDKGNRVQVKLLYI